VAMEEGAGVEEEGAAEEGADSEGKSEFPTSFPRQPCMHSPPQVNDCAWCATPSMISAPASLITEAHLLAHAMASLCQVLMRIGLRLSTARVTCCATEQEIPLNW